MSGGFTLIEALLASVILTLVVGAILMPFTAGAQNAVQNAREVLAANLAQELMEEILSKSFNDPDGTNAGETNRMKWDDMRDYNNFSESQGNIKNLSGEIFTDPLASNMSRTAKVESVYVAGQDTSNPPTFLRITVEVRYKGQVIKRISRLVYENKK